MGASFEFAEPTRFTAGAVGEPGQRVFYLQSAQGARTVSLRCEKQQVGALGEYLDQLLDNLPTRHLDDLPKDLDLTGPLEAEWAIGALGVAYDGDADRIVISAQELVADDEEGGDDAPAAATAQFAITREQAVAFVNTARRLMVGGRPPCKLCGRPLDAAGHVCPRTNGHAGTPRD
ncbi:MAG: DUF3090 family protein [Acidimicrobiales bacterium]